MENYKFVNANIYCCSNKYYVIKKNYKLYVYDYEHHLVFESKPIKNIIYGNFVSDDLIYFGMTVKRLIYRLDIKEKKLEKIKYTNFSYPDAHNIYEINDDIYIFYSGYDKKYGEEYGSHEYAFAMLDKETGKISQNFILPYHTSSSFTINQKMYFTVINRDDNDYYRCYLYERDESNKLIHEFSVLSSEIGMIISNNKRYMIIASVESEQHFGEIIIYDLLKNIIIDKIIYEHVGCYRTVYQYFSYCGKDYIIFQANPIYCTWDNAIWHTYLYSIQDKKVIIKYPSASLIRYIPKQKTMMIETANYRKSTEFLTVDDKKENLFEVLNEVHKNVREKSKKKSEIYFCESLFQGNKSLEEYSDEQVIDIFEKFVESADERVECLFKVINLLENVPLAYDYSTFIKVLNWYFSVFNVKFDNSKKLSSERRENLKEDKFLYKYQFTNLTYTTMIYIGTYIGRLIQHYVSGSFWKLDTDKKSDHYRQVYIKKSNDKIIYPLIDIEVLSRKYIEKKRLNIDELFYNWIDSE